MSSKSPDPSDTHVGSRVRMRRRLLEMSQAALAAALGITFQQVQKYENGTNRVSASRLQQISSFLQVPISFFFDGLPEPPNKSAKNASAPPPSDVFQFLATTDGLALCKAFMQIKSRSLRSAIVHIVEDLARPD
jgi:transcriptional regulator with XRE-family HTH domain